MRITHITLTGLYTDSFTYQDNLLPKFHQRLGNKVSIISSHYMYDEEGEISYDQRNKYINEFGVSVIRLNINKGNSILNKFKRFENLYSTIEETDPDIIFIHGCQFIDLKIVIEFKKKNPKTVLYLDNHADFSNSAQSFISKNILHKIIWKSNIKRSLPYVKKYYGVLPSRVDFLKKVYNVPEDKVDLLVLGADDDMIELVKNSGYKNRIRDKYNIKKTDFLIVTGGKIDSAKLQTTLLMQAVKDIERNNVKLLVFGSIDHSIKDMILNLVDDDKIMYVGWVSPKESYQYFSAADLVVFPGRHSVFWEQVVGLGVPIVAKYWPGTTHIDVGGNCKFLYEDSVQEISNAIVELVDSSELYERMKKIALRNGVEQFSYSKIAKKSIDI